jgi:CheY-like chemotaxis protein
MPVSITIVEDEPRVVSSLRRLFRRHGLDAFLVHEARSIVEATSWPNPDCVILDIGLADTVGPVSVARCRELLPDAPIVVLSASPPEEMAASCYAAGAVAYLHKPDVMHDAGFPRLLRAIDHAMAGRHGNEWVEHTPPMGVRQMRALAARIEKRNGSSNGRTWLNWSAASATVAIVGLGFGSGFCAPPWDVERKSHAAATYETKKDAADKQVGLGKQIDSVHTDVRELRISIENLRSDLSRRRGR